MSIRCSLLGHEFGETEREREREERGDEVVITIQEVQTCERCGTEQVLTENTEVRPVEPISDVEDTGSDIVDGETGEPEADVGGGADSGVGGAGGDVGGAFVDDDPEGAGPETETGPETSPEADADDGVIIDGDEEQLDRTAGEWPDAEDTRVDERDVPAEAGPEVEVETDTASGAEADAAAEVDDDEDAEILDGSEEGEPEPDTSGVEGEPDTNEKAAGEDASGEGESTAGESTSEAADASAGGATAGGASEWPDPAGEDRGFDAEPGAERTELEFSGIAPESDREVGTRTPSESPSLDADSETTFVCPECGFSQSTERSSLRAGDICPECQKGYIREE